MKKKGSTTTFEWIAVAVLAIIVVFVFGIIYSKMTYGPEFIYTGCEGDIGGQKCYQYSGCTTTEPLEYETFVGYSHPRCTLYDTKDLCVSAYPNITRGEEDEEQEEISICVWIDHCQFDTNKDGKPGTNTDGCLANPKLQCADLSQFTVPKCSDFLDCEPKVAMKEAIEELYPHV